MLLVLVTTRKIYPFAADAGHFGVFCSIDKVLVTSKHRSYHSGNYTTFFNLLSNYPDTTPQPF